MTITDRPPVSEPSLDAVVQDAAQVVQQQLTPEQAALSSAEAKLAAAKDQLARAEESHAEYEATYNTKYPDRPDLTKALDQDRINQGIKLGQAVAGFNKATVRQEKAQDVLTNRPQS